MRKGGVQVVQIKVVSCCSENNISSVSVRTKTGDLNLPIPTPNTSLKQLNSSSPCKINLTAPQQWEMCVFWLCILILPEEFLVKIYSKSPTVA